MTELNIGDKANGLAQAAGIDSAQLRRVAADIEKVAAEQGLDLKLPIVAGLDVNGPIVSTDDADIHPYPGSPECIGYLMDLPEVEVSLMTGWDLATMSFFRQQRLNLPDMGIVGEYGMVFERRGTVKHLYPFRESESLEFMSAVFASVAPEGLKVAFQGNYSAGAGAIYIEGDENGNLLSHPLVKDRVPTIEQIYNEAKGESDLEFDRAAGKIVFVNKPANMKGLFETIMRRHPLISVRTAAVSEDKISIELDFQDRPGFDFEALKKFAARLESETGRSPLVYEDHGCDLLSEEAKTGDYYKQAGLHAYGVEAFGDVPFVKMIVGDKSNDAPRIFEGTIFFPQAGSQAEEFAAEKGIPSVIIDDVRDFSLALAELRRGL
ncbi:hypothetical protein ACFLT7_01200 [candidate division KSB1 bacterium]